jgi:hypothetical protein
MKTAALVFALGFIGFWVGVFFTDRMFQSGGPPALFIGAVTLIPLATAIGVALGLYLARRLWS